MIDQSNTTPARIKLPNTPEVEAAARAGFDLHLIEENLNLTYDQRAQAHESALALMSELQRQYAKTVGGLADVAA